MAHFYENIFLHHYMDVTEKSFHWEEGSIKEFEKLGSSVRVGLK